MHWQRDRPSLAEPSGPQLGYEAMTAFHVSLPLSMSERLTNELESSTDTPLVGATGEALVIETSLLRQFRASAQVMPKRFDVVDGVYLELTKSAAFGERLLEKARNLDPENPRWRREQVPKR